MKVKPNFNNSLFEPDPKTRAISGSTPTPLDYGGLGAQYTSHRVFPLYTGDAWWYSADVKGPYRKAGKLFFTQPGVGDFVCSAAVIKPRVVLTAGHCVHSGDGTQNGWFTNFLFVPAFRDGVAPYGVWDWSVTATTGEWFSGDGTVPNEADYAVIVVTNSNDYRLGDITAWFGWQTNSLYPNHVTMLGYPCNLDSCQKMHQVDSESFGVQEPAL